jgi:fucose 4-O-acetylase-like acetyltransferase
MNQTKLDWLSILRGWVVILVIIRHSPFEEFESSSVVNTFETFNAVFGFRMPLFFFISGFLLYYTKIKKDSSYLTIIKERIPRIVYPYFFLTLLVFCIKLIFSSHVKRVVSFSFSELLNIFIYPENNPWLIYWFLNAILIYFLIYPILKCSLKNIYISISTLLLCLGLNLFFPKDITFLDLSTVVNYLVYFYSGILFSKYALQNRIKGKRMGLLILILFVSSIFWDYNKIVHSFSGILISVYLSLLCAKKSAESLFRF